MHFSPDEEARSLLVFEGLVCSLNQVQVLVSYYLLDGMAGPITTRRWSSAASQM